MARESDQPKTGGHQLAGIVHLTHNLLQCYQWNIFCVLSQKSKDTRNTVCCYQEVYLMHVLILRKFMEIFMNEKKIIEYNGLKSQEEGNFFLTAWSQKKLLYFSTVLLGI